ncbi:MAG TPA: phospho-sugar mutase [Pirellulales bacterium]|jgi:phosphoglucomutase/phosphomannomutase|nr:phospho-sugar mutase [Pirellulales bacterium]
MSTFDLTAALAQLDQAAAAKQLTADSAAMIRRWLTEPRYADYTAEVAAQIAAGRWKELDDVFWTVIPFGTGGRRGKMYPVGSNAINDRTIGESAQGVADYVAAYLAPGESPGANCTKPSLSCAIAYDTRHRSRHFAELCAEVMVAAGFKVFFLDGFRSTPELSFAVRHTNSSCGIMVTASHNPPSDNAVKVYWAGGVQVLPPHDKAIIDRVMNVDVIRRKPFAEALAAGQVVYCQDAVDAAFIAAVHKQALPGPRQLKIIYSPLHGVGASAVLPALQADGFQEVELFAPQAEPNGDFPNVPGHVANPENPAVYNSMIERAQQTGADVILASDPDCDRLGAAAPLTMQKAESRGQTTEASDQLNSPFPIPHSPFNSQWKPFTGNQLAALLAEYVLAARKKAGTLSPQHYVVKTLVTTEMVRRIAEHFGVQTHGNLQVGFKWIGQEIDAAGPERFVFGCEESHGYLVGTHVRDKDAAVAAMLLAELAAACKSQGKTLHEQLDALYWQYGYHSEIQFSLTMSGAAGMQDMQKLMARFRSTPPTQLAGIQVRRMRDYQSLTQFALGQAPEKFSGPPGDMVMLDLTAAGNYVAVRPSGTEPKVKFYMFTFAPAEQIANLDDTKAECAARLQKMQADLSAFAGNA